MPPKKQKKDIIQEFIDGTPHWVAQMEKMKEINGREMCVYCGVVPSSMIELIKEIEELREKAWKYDDLST